MSGIPIEAVMAELRRRPQGATTTELAQALNISRDTLGSRLSKQFFYGRLDVVREERAIDSRRGRSREYVWRAAP